MATFEELQRSFRECNFGKIYCSALDGQKREPCPTELTPGQKEKLTVMFKKKKDQLVIDELRTIIWDVLCADHQAKHRNYEKQVEARWKKEFPMEEYPLMNFSVNRSRSRTTSLSRPSTPTPQPKISPSSSGKHLTAYFPSSSPHSTPVIEEDVAHYSPLVHRSSYDLSEKTVVESIEPVPLEQLSTKGDENGVGDVSRFESSPAQDGQVEQEGLDLEEGLLDHRWGDRSAAVGGEKSERRQYYVYRDRDGKLKKEPEQSFDRLAPTNTSRSTPSKLEDPFIDTDLRDFSPPETSKRPSKFPKSREPSERIPSPSVLPLTKRSNHAYGTMTRDAIYDRHPRDNESNVINLIHKEVNYRDQKSFGRVGWLYVVRDPELELIKIGFTKQVPPKHRPPGQQRFRRFKSECKLSSDAELIEDDDKEGVILCKHLEDLVHEDLRPHRIYFDCECGLVRGRHLTEHHEWYDITTEVALDTVKLWREFIRRDPYGLISNGSKHRLQDYWLERLNHRPVAAADEKHEHHARRLERWRTILQTQSSQTFGPAVPASKLNIIEPSAVNFSGFKIKEEEDPSSTSLYDLPPATVEQQDFPPLPDTNSPDILRNGEFCSRPTTPASSMAAVTRSNSLAAREVVAESVESSAERLVTAENDFATLSETEALATMEIEEVNGIAIEDFATKTFRLSDLIGSLDVRLRKHHAGLPSRSAYDDLFTFRWPFASAVILATCSSHLPPALSWLFWLVFLPFFVAELREWHHEEAV